MCEFYFHLATTTQERIEERADIREVNGGDEIFNPHTNVSREVAILHTHTHTHTRMEYTCIQTSTIAHPSPSPSPSSVEFHHLASLTNSRRIPRPRQPLTLIPIPQNNPPRNHQRIPHTQRLQKLPPHIHPHIRSREVRRRQRRLNPFLRLHVASDEGAEGLREPIQVGAGRVAGDLVDEVVG